MADLPAIRITATDQASAVIGGVGRSLGAFAAQIVSLGAIMESMRRALNLGDELKQMSDTTGLAVAKLDQLSIIASQNGTSLEGMAKGFKFLTTTMVEAQRNSSQAGQIFAALGVAVKDTAGNLRNVDAVMGDVADSLNTIENETTRAAAGQAIFGKGYLEIAAALRNYRESQEVANQVLERYGAVSETAARVSDELKDKITLLGEGSKRSLLNGLVPGLAAVSAALDSATRSGGGFTSWLGQQFALDMRDGSIIVTKLDFLLQGLALRWDYFKKSFTATGDMTAEIERAFQRLEQRRQAALGDIRTSFKFPGLDDSEQVSRAASAQDRLNATRANAARIADILAPKERALADIYGDLQRELLAQVATAAELSAADRLEIKLAEDKYRVLNQGQREHLLGIAKTIDALKAQTEATKRAVEADKEGLDHMLALKKSYEDSEKSVQDYVEGLEFEVKTMQMSNEERQVAIALRELERKGIKLSAEELEQYRQRVIEATETKAALQEQIDFWKKIEDAGREAWMHIFEGGKSVLDRLLGSLKQIALELAYMAAKRWVLNIAVGATGIGGAGGAAAGGLGGGGGLGGLGSLGSLFGGAGGVSSGLNSFLGGSFATGAGFGVDSGLLGAGAGGWVSAEGGLGLLSGGGSALAGVAAAMPYIAAVVAVGMLVKNFLDSKKGGPKVGGGAGFQTYFPGEGTTEGDAAMQKLLDTNVAAYQQVVKSLGGKGIGTFAFGFDTDPQGTAPNRLHVGAMVNGKSVYDAALGDLGRDPAVLQARLQLEAKRALLAALQASGLQQDIAAYLGALTASTATEAEIDNALKMAGALKAVFDVFDKDVMADAMDAFAQASTGAQGALARQITAIRKLVAEYDGSADAASALASATNDFYMSAVAVVAQIESIKREVGKSFEESARFYKMSGLDNSGKYAYLAAEVAKLQQELAGTTDATRIREIAAQINADQREAFGLLTPEQQVAMAQSFVDAAERANGEVQSRLADAQQAIADDTRQLIADVREALVAGIRPLEDAAIKIGEAADTMQQAANTPLVVEVDVSGSAVVNGG